MATTNTISTKERKVRALVISVIGELLNDPDFGLELSDRAKKRLRARASSRQKNVSLTEIKEKYL